jgi:hypothetical protein
VLIEDYFLHLERVIAACPQIELVTLTKEKRAPHIGLVKGKILFSGGIELFIMAFVHTESRVFKTKYRYHCQGAEGNPLFRYDNAPHHVTETFPHHKHLFRPLDRETIIAAHPPTIEALLDEILGLRGEGEKG